MGRIQENIIRRDQVVAAIHVLLENQGIDSGSDWDIDPDNLKKLNALADSSMACTVYSGDLGITQEEDETKLVFAVASGDSEYFQQNLSGEAAKALAERGTKTIQFVFFVPNMQSRISLETKFDRTNLMELKKAIQNEMSSPGNRPQKTFKLLVNYILLQEYAEQDIRLTDLHSLEMLHEPPIDRSINIESNNNTETGSKDAGDIQARVFTVDLYQLVQKYNLIGDILFQNNVRFGINETLGVEQSMIETLSSEPQNFWFKNNGVTFLIQNSRTFLQESKTVFLGKLDPNKPLSFSIINGAQTITTAARYFFGLEAKAVKDAGAMQKLTDAKQHAHVLVRIINVVNEDNEKAAKDSRAISVALNRQKPIRMDDIAFTHPAVQKLADYLQRTKDAPFTLVRQGETATNHRSIDLLSFARARMACAGLPGAARTKGRDKLLELKSNEDGSTSFAQAKLFSPVWLAAEEEEETAIFRQDYNAVLFAHQLAKAYEAEMRKYESPDRDTEVLNAVKNGKWYFTAIITQIMNTFQTDYFNFSAGTISGLPQLMTSLAQVMVREANIMGDKKEINSNLFKNEKLYCRIIEKLKANQKAGSLLMPVSDDQISALLSDVKNQYDAAASSASYVVLGNARTEVSSDAQALLFIAEYILDNYPEAEENLLNNCGSWFTCAAHASPEGKILFSSHKKYYAINPNANWEVKRRRMTTMCEIANVRHGTIKWYKSKMDAFIFTW